MTILVTGATGTVGRQVIEQLVKRGADVRALVRDPAKANFPAGVAVVQGDLLDVDSLRGAFSGVSTLFLLNAVVPDEFTQALIALNLAREAGVERIVYLSVIHSDLYVNVPHFAGKFGVERMIEQMGFNATILRPAYFIEQRPHDQGRGARIRRLPDADRRQGARHDRRTRHRRDRGHRAASAASSPRRRCRSTRINLVGPDTLTGADVAGIWSEVLGRPIAYGGDDTAGVRAEPQAVHAELDGVRHAPDERAFPHRRNDPRRRRRRAPDCAPRASAALLSRLRLRDRSLGLTAQATRSIDSKERLAVDAEATR